MMNAQQNSVTFTQFTMVPYSIIISFRIFSGGQIPLQLPRHQRSIQRPGIEPGTSAVLRPRHNQLDHLCLENRPVLSTIITLNKQIAQIIHQNFLQKQIFRKVHTVLYCAGTVRYLREILWYGTIPDHFHIIYLHTCTRISQFLLPQKHYDGTITVLWTHGHMDSFTHL